MFLDDFIKRNPSCKELTWFHFFKISLIVGYQVYSWVHRFVKAAFNFYSLTIPPPDEEREVDLRTCVDEEGDIDDESDVELDLDLDLDLDSEHNEDDLKSDSPQNKEYLLSL